MRPDEFKATVVDFIERQDRDRLPRLHEVVLIGRDAQGWKRARIKRPYTWVAPLMVRAFTRRWASENVAVILPGDAPREFRVGFAARGEDGDPGEIADRRLGRLVAAARREWSRKSEPLLTISGMPWPIALLVLALFLDLLLGAYRFPWTLAGGYRWLPLFPDPISAGLYVAYLLLVVATIHQLWRQTRAGYVLALVLAAVQLARFATFLGSGVSPLWVVEALLFPATIASCLFIVWQANAASAGARVTREKK